MAEINVEYLNEIAKTQPERLVVKSEDYYHKKIFDIVKTIIDSGSIRVVLLAGPSGSGKTTTAKLLSDAIMSRGIESIVVSLDNFYKNPGDPTYPILENGDVDYESIDALHVEDIKKTLSDIAMGNAFSLPRYDFKVGARTEVKKHKAMPSGVVIVEGLHALNPRIFESLPKENMLRIFISVSTNVNKDEKRILSGRKIRFIRRMVRDSIYRASDAERTLGMWENVLAGEDKYLYPFRGNADVSIDTFHNFELGVMKPMVEKLISEELAEKNEYAKTVLCAVRSAEAIDESHVPENSLIREFISGGKYEEFY